MQKSEARLGEALQERETYSAEQVCHREFELPFDDFERGEVRDQYI